MAGYKKVYRKSKKSSGKHLTKTQKKEVKALVKPMIETKFASDTGANVDGALVPATIQTAAYYGAMPPLFIGTGQNQRIGDRVGASVLQMSFRFWLQPETTITQNGVVKLFILESRRVKSQASMSAAPDLGRLLNLGNGSNTDWLGAGSGLANLQFDMMPVNKEDFIVRKIYRFRLAKNADWTNGGGGASAPPNTYAQSTKSITCSIKLKGLKYDGTAGYPTDRFIVYYPIWFADNNSTATSQPSFSYRGQLYFKDG